MTSWKRLKADCEQVGMEFLHPFVLKLHLRIFLVLNISKSVVSLLFYVMISSTISNQQSIFVDHFSEFYPSQ